MEPTQELIDELFIDKVMAARQRSFEQKFLAGGELHEAVIERMKMGILLQNPAADEQTINREIHRRFQITELLEKAQ
jgi:hypothetical protein